MKDIKLFGSIYRNVPSIKVTDTNDNELTYVLEDETRYSADEFASGQVGGVITLDNYDYDIRERSFANTQIAGVNITFTASSKKINGYAFSSCPNLADINFNYCTFAGAYNFSSCASLEHLHLEGFTSGNYSFASCSNLETVVITDCHNVNWTTGTFRYCSKLAKADFTNVGQFGQQCFQGSKLNDLVLRRTDAITTLNNINAFAGMGGRSVTVYVPNSLLSDYQSDSKWSVVTDATLTFTAIEGSQYEHYYVDGTEIQND